MKGVHCSWVDMMKIRQMLAGKKRGDQKALRGMRCVDKSTVSDWQAVCDVIEVVEPKVGISQLSHTQPSHAKEIARHFRKAAGKGWSEEKREEVVEWVERCEAEGWTVPELRQALIGESVQGSCEEPCEIKDLYEAVAAGDRFGTIYMDPPWAYENQATRASTDNHYPTLTVEKLCDPTFLPVAALAADCCHLHLWTTNAFLFECPRLFAAWGFIYQGVYVWCKQQIGIGNCWRVSHEFLVLAIRGEPRSFATHDLKSWGTFPRGEHSSKPEPVRFLIEKASPGPRLELFARQTYPGWHCWGNQIEKTLFNQQGHHT